MSWQRGFWHVLIDPTNILLAQTNPLIDVKVLEDKIERLEDGNTIKGMDNGSTKKKVSGKTKNN